MKGKKRLLFPKQKDFSTTSEPNNSESIQQFLELQNYLRESAHDISFAIRDCQTQVLCAVS